MIAYQCFPLYVDPMKLNFSLIVGSFPFRCPAGMGGSYHANRSNHASLPANKILIGVYNLGIYIYINIMTLVLDMFTQMIQELNELLE